MKKPLLGICLGVLLMAILVAPALAAYYAYIYVSEDSGNSYDDLAVSCPANIDNLLQGGFITTTGLDTRVLTGDSAPLPHMVAEDRVLFVTDLDAYEDKSLIFYTGATSLSAFPIIVGYNGSFVTPDDPDLEHTVVTELLVSGYFDTAGGFERHIVYKEGAYKVDVDDSNTLTVAWLEAGDTVQWELEYASFTPGDHTIYVFTNGLVAYLYVDDFDVAKDTANLFASTSYQCINKNVMTTSRCFYDEGYYWIFYQYDGTNLGYITSPDGVSWSGETQIPIVGGDSYGQFDAKMRDGYLHICYADGSGTDYIRYRRGDLTSAPGITWSAGWQEVAEETGGAGYSFHYPYIAIDTNQYPYIAWEHRKNYNDYGYCTKSSTNDGTWSTAGGYPFQLWYAGSNNGIMRGFMHYPASDKLLLLWERHGYDTWWDWTCCQYYNGSSWEPIDTISSYIGDMGGATMAADENDNMYIGWVYGATNTRRLTVRYDGEVWETIDLTTTGSGTPQLSYNEDTNVLYTLYGETTGSDYVYCITLDTDVMELNIPVAIVPLLDGFMAGANPYENHIGFTLLDNPNTYHGYIDLTAYEWNDNSNNWTWMQNNVMPYAVEFRMAIDGTLQLDYVPSSIIVDDTLPDEELNHDAIINWGTNPTGVTASMGPLQSEDPVDSAYYYQNLQPDPQDIIKPEPASTSGDVDLEGLRDNPAYPIIAIMGGTPFLTERLAWLLFAWFIVIGAMLLVHLGFDTRPNTPKPQHFILTTITGLGLSILFYSMGIFAWPVILLMCFGLGAAILWERQPVM